MENNKYFSRSWAMLTRDRGWFKPILVMAAANLVPIAGALGNKGYGLEWARLSAWGVDSAPKQKNVNVGKLIGSGWRGFVVDLVWILLWCLVTAIVSVMSTFPGAIGDLLSFLMGLCLSVLGMFLTVAIMIAQVRAAIYESIAAGLRFGSVWEMIKRDANGFCRLVLTCFVSMLVVGLVSAVVGLVVLIPLMPAFFMAVGTGSNSYAVATAILSAVTVIIPMLMLLGYALSVVTSAVGLLLINATGLWMRQFSVPEWGKSSDPLPRQNNAEGQYEYNEYTAAHAPYEQEPAWEPVPEAPAPAPAPMAAPESEPEPVVQESEPAEPEHGPQTQEVATEPNLVVSEAEPAPAEPEPEDVAPEPELEAAHMEDPQDETIALPGPDDQTQVLFAEEEKPDQKTTDELFEEFRSVVEENDKTDDE